MPVLESRFDEISFHQHAWLDRSPATTIEILGDLVGRLSSASASVSALDGQPAPSPDALAPIAVQIATRPGPSGALSDRLPWLALDALAPRLLSLESRVGAIDRVAVPDASADVLAPIAAEVAGVGFGARHEERFHQAIKQLITGTLALESRIGALAAPKPAA